MQYFWKNGFMLISVNCKEPPQDGVEITEKQYHTLLQGQRKGKRIITDADGYPILADRIRKVDPKIAAERLFRKLQIRAAALAIPAADDAAAFTLAPLCKTWTAGAHYDALEIVNHEGRPYRVVQAVDSLEHQMPGAAGMLAIYRPIDPAPGTRDDPKTFYFGMDVKEGLYYTSAGKLYLAKADLPACTYAPGTDGVWQWEEVADTE